MQANRIFRFQLILMFAVLSLCNLARGDEPQLLKIALEVSIKIELPNQTPVARRAYVSAEGAKFAFLMPYHYQFASTKETGELKLYNENRNGSIRLAIISPATSSSGELNAEIYRDWLLAQHPGAKIIEESSGRAGGKSGPAFDLEWKTSSGIMQSQHVVFVPSEIGVLQFSATSTSEKFEEIRSNLHGILNTFYFSANGKLDVPPLSDRL